MYVSIVQLCECVFAIGSPLYVPQNGGFGGFEAVNVKILWSNPEKAHP